MIIREDKEKVMGFSIVDGEKTVPILVERESFSGIRRIAGVLADDICSVCRKKPEVIDESGLESYTGKELIICAVYGKSDMLSRLERDGKFNPECIAGKWEVYTTFLVEAPFDGVDKALVIAGSDKRGTIYGMLSLSEYIGVTAFEYMGDVRPVEKKNIAIGEDFFTVSKEPSVKYRGFFINDEWPCFGNWVCEHFGGFNAKAYEKIFIFLLRMKGNYMWPAMWSASFPLDGPGSANEELADELGVVMGYSHHEPCLRASEEWDKVRGEGTKYGNAWNYATNREGLINYWKDALIRSGRYDNLITIGMRGERDTSMLGDDSSIRDNVELLKEIITKQKELINTYVKPYRDNPPMLLALYKEVEQYYYGDEENEGLCEWSELDDVICMLCEDNFGYTRTLPTERMRNAGKRFGMYYHLDYHGGPVSYEWVDSTPFSLIWEQMSQVYDSGIRDVWIVNVGDLKFHEVPLSYFMSMAYDYDKWGSSNPDSYHQYIEKWSGENFAAADTLIRKKIDFVLNEYIKINYLRRPESLNPQIYDGCSFNEAAELLKRADRVCTCAREVYNILDRKDKEAFYSMVYYPAMASMNNVKLNLYASLNHHYASQGRRIANKYRKLAENCMAIDKEYINEFSEFTDGKWNGMQLASHIGFTKWNEDGCRMPVLCEVYPVDGSRMNVSRSDEPALYDKVYGAPRVMTIDDFLYPGENNVRIEIANDGREVLSYTITGNGMELPGWLKLSGTEGEVEDLAEVEISVDKSLLCEDCESRASLKISDGVTTVIVDIRAKGESRENVSDGCVFTAQNNTTIIRADHYYRLDNTQAELKVLADYGKYGAGLKVFPVTFKAGNYEEAPRVTYCFDVEKPAEYVIRFFMTPSNPFIKGRAFTLAYSIQTKEEYDSAQNQKVHDVEVLPKDYRAGENSDIRWCEGVLSQIRTADVKEGLERGRYMLTVYAMEPGMVLQQIGIYCDGGESKRSYLGRKETEYIGK